MLSQWIPTPFPISRQSLSSSSLAFLSLGNHNNGTPISLPSWRCTKSISLLNQTLDARTFVDLFVKVLIPFISYMNLVFVNNLTDLSQLFTCETIIDSNKKRIDPEFCIFLCLFNMNMQRLISFIAEEEKSITIY
jgi:hypothetical protein